MPPGGERRRWAVLAAGMAAMATVIATVGYRTAFAAAAVFPLAAALMTPAGRRAPIDAATRDRP